MADHFASQVTGTQLRSFEDILSTAGMTGDRLKAVLKDPNLAEVMVEALEKALDPSANQIRIKFEVSGRKYEVVPFVKRNGTVSGDEMIRRTAAENGGGLGEEEGNFLWEHRAELPAKLHSYYLVFTKWREDYHLRRVRCFIWNGGQWDQSLNVLDDWWDGNHAVVRRLA